MARKIVIDTPRGCVSTYRLASGQITARLDWNPDFKPNKERAFRNAQEFVDSECIRYMNPLTPRLTGVMAKSVSLGTEIGSGHLEYLVPYDRRQYYEHKEKSRWFEAMKAQKKEIILKGAERIAGS